jgi:hypothetical protein
MLFVVSISMQTNGYTDLEMHVVRPPVYAESLPQFLCYYLALESMP